MCQQPRWGAGDATVRPAVSAVAAAVLGGLSLAACQQPTPGVTVQSGSHVIRTAATLYSRGGKEIRGSGAVKVLTAYPGALVGIDVDRALADNGWSVHITPRTADRSTLDSPVLKGQSHFAFDVGGTLTDVVVAEAGVGAAPAGLWLFTIQPSLR